MKIKNFKNFFGKKHEIKYNSGDVVRAIKNGDINELEKRLDRVHYNWTQDFVNRFKANPSECLHELRTQRAISNMFFDFVMDFAKVGLAEIPPERTVRQLSEFITFWIKEHFKRGCDERKSGPEYRLTLDELAQRYSEGKPA